jgi:hypothetical protein
VKEGVYLPDWRNDERLRYNGRTLADLLAQLLPDGLQGSVIQFRARSSRQCKKPGTRSVSRRISFHHVAHLVELKRRTGRHIALALEPGAMLLPGDGGRDCGCSSIGICSVVQRWRD